MQRIIAVATLTVAMISMGAARAHAQAVEAKISFNFNVGNRELPAGTYRIQRNTTGNAIVIRSLDGRNTAFTVTLDSDFTLTGRGQLVFTDYGSQRFLHQVTCNPVGMNAALPVSRLEEQTRLREASHPRGESVVAALAVGVR